MYSYDTDLELIPVNFMTSYMYADAWLDVDDWLFPYLRVFSQKYVVYGLVRSSNKDDFLVNNILILGKCIYTNLSTFYFFLFSCMHLILIFNANMLKLKSKSFMYFTPSFTDEA